jgi:hypothetical protein
VTPDPKEFGYSATLNDMPKPAFLAVDKAGDKQPNAGVLSLNSGSPLNVAIPISVPENYPSNRLLQVSVYDPATRSVVATVDRKLQDSLAKKRPDGASLVELALPAIQRPGSYVLDAKLTSETTSDNGARQVLPSPVTCNTAVVQPIKARSCRLLSLQVH